MRRRAAGAKRPGSSLKRNQPVSTKKPVPAEKRPVPAAFPILVGLGDPPKTFPGVLLHNGRCIAAHGRSLANMAERGGLSVWEIVANVLELEPEALREITLENANRMVAKMAVDYWRGAQ